MGPMEILAVADGLVGLLERLAPSIAALVKKGEITAEQQKAMDERVAALRPGGSGFAGPEWVVER